jgi:photosystem II stability/assembly factor-like uncharacterized protein
VKTTFSVFCWVLLLFPPRSAVLAGESSRPKVSPQVQAYVEWLAGPWQSRPVAAPPDLLKTIPPSHGRLPGEEAEGDAIVETKDFARSHPNPEEWTPEKQATDFEFAGAKRIEELKSDPRETFSPPSTWLQAGPFGMESRCRPGYIYSGRVTCIDYNAATGLYLGTAGGGLWGPPILYPLSDNVASLTVDAVAVNPADPDIIFIGTTAGLYRTTDHGKNWALAPIPGRMPLRTYKLLIPPWDDQTVFAATDIGIYKSDDAGDNWHRVFGIGTWDISTATRGKPMLAGVRGTPSEAGIYRSMNFGETWVKDYSSDLPTSKIGRISVAVAPSDSSRAYVLIGDSETQWVLGVYRTDFAALYGPEWVDVTPTGGLKEFMWGQQSYNNAMAVHPNVRDHLWLGGGALLRSTDGGSSWDQYGYGLHADVHALFYRPGDNLLYVGSDGGIETTADEGVSWSFVLNSFLPTTMFYNIDVARYDHRVKWGASQDNAAEGTTAADPVAWNISSVADGIDVAVDWSDPAVVYNTTQLKKVYKTVTSGGECLCGFPEDAWCSYWYRINGSLKATGWSAHVIQDPVKSQWIYFNGERNIYFSSDGGASWGTVNATAFTSDVMQLEISSDGYTIYAVSDVQSERLVKYQWNGSVGSPAWTETNLGFSGIPYPIPQKVIPSMTEPARAYVIVDGPWAFRDSRIYRTTDRGDSWTNITGDFLGNIAIHDLLESPVDNNILWIGTDMSVFKSTDGGGTWWGWNDGMPRAAVVKDLEYASAEDGAYLVAGTFGRSTFERDVNAPIFRISSTGRPALGFGGLGDLVVGPSDSSYVEVSTDAGASWSVASTPAPGSLYDATFPDPSRVVAVGEGGAIVSSTDSGGTWSPVASPVQSDLRRLAFSTPSDGFAVGDAGTILRSIDGGVSWQTLTTGAAGDYNAVCFVDPSRGWIGGTDSSTQPPVPFLLRTTDGGVTWPQLPPTGASGTLRDVVFPTASVGYLSIEGSGIYKTTDGGQSWATAPTGILQSFFDINFIDADRGWAGGPGGILIHTTDGGATWVSEPTGVNENLHAIFFSGGRLLVGGTTGVLSRGVSVPVELNSEVKNGWNLVSLPLAVEDNRKESLFPGALTSAFAYQGQYIQSPVLGNGIGYWLKFPGAQTVPISGFPRHAIDVGVTAGWNLIGPGSSPVPVSTVSTTPGGIVQSMFFGYDMGYQAASVLEPSKAYWVKVSQDGSLRLTGLTQSSDSEAVIHSAATGSTFSSMDVRNSTGGEQTLWFTSRATDDAVLARYECPPLPPSGAFDVRFGTGRLLEASGAAARDVPIRISYPIYPLTFSWNIPPSDDPASLILDGRIVSLAGAGSTVISDPVSDIRLRLSASGSGEVPEEFSLASNYPNPFNPVTTLRYELPVASRVNLSVYDVLGRLVTTLADGVEDAGYRRAEWNSTNEAGLSVTSGVYFYRLQATGVGEPGRTFTGTGKMLLLR